MNMSMTTSEYEYECECLLECKPVRKYKYENVCMSHDVNLIVNPSVGSESDCWCEYEHECKLKFAS